MEIYINGVVSKMVTNLGPQVQHQYRKTASFQQQINHTMANRKTIQWSTEKNHEGEK
jgi:chaperonin cofactor prefoldin